MLNTNLVISQGSLVTAICEVPVKHPQLVKKRTEISSHEKKVDQQVLYSVIYFLLYINSVYKIAK